MFAWCSSRRMVEEKNLWILKRKQKTRQIHKCKRILLCRGKKEKNQCMSWIESMKTPWTYFMLDAYCFRLVCVLISMNWIIHKNLNSCSKVEFITFCKCEIYSKKTWRFYALEANKKCNWIIAKKPAKWV